MRPGDPDENGLPVTGGRSLAKKITVYNMTYGMDYSGSSIMSMTSMLPTSINAGVYTDYPSQAGCFYQWANSNYPRRSIHPAAGDISGYNYTSATGFWNSLESSHEICPTGYHRPHAGSITADEVHSEFDISELNQSLMLKEDNYSLYNHVYGYYADGFFDRHKIEDKALGTGSAVFSSVASTKAGARVAYIGQLYYNPYNNASVFFPFAGRRDHITGSLYDAGLGAYYLTASRYFSGLNSHFFKALYVHGKFATISGAVSSQATKVTVLGNIRCVAD